MALARLFNRAYFSLDRVTERSGADTEDGGRTKDEDRERCQNEDAGGAAYLSTVSCSCTAHDPPRGPSLSHRPWTAGDALSNRREKMA
jgi:hypothetical protein